MATLSEIAKATGAKPRTVQLWADAGVIIADPGTDREGSGRHRQFGKDEVVIACVVAPFAVDKMAIGGLLGIAQAVRTYQRNENEEAFDNAVNGTGDSFLILEMRAAKGNGAPITYTARIVGSSKPSNQTILKFIAHSTRDFPLVRILSLNPVLKPIKSLNF